MAGTNPVGRQLLELRLIRLWVEFLEFSLKRCLDLSKDERFQLIFTFLQAKGDNTDALDRELLANRRDESVLRRAWQSLQDFFATEKWPVTTDDARRASIMCAVLCLTPAYHRRVPRMFKKR